MGVSCLMGKRALCVLHRAPCDAGGWLGLSVAGERHGQAGFVTGLPGRKIAAAVRNVDLSCMALWVSPDSVKS